MVTLMVCQVNWSWKIDFSIFVIGFFIFSPIFSSHSFLIKCTGAPVVDSLQNISTDELANEYFRRIKASFSQTTTAAPLPAGGYAPVPPTGTPAKKKNQRPEPINEPEKLEYPTQPRYTERDENPFSNGMKPENEPETLEYPAPPRYTERDENPFMGWTPSILRKIKLSQLILQRREFKEIHRHIVLE